MSPGQSSSDAVAEALARLEISRARLRQEMIPPPPARLPPGSPLPTRLRALWRYLRRKAGGWPVAGFAAAALGEWWHHHPWRPAGELLVDEIQVSALPWLRRHPVVTVAAAATLGAALVVSRPWRWPGVAERVRPMPRRLGRWLIRQFSQAPVQATLLSILMLFVKPAARAASGAAPAPGAGPAQEAARQPSPTHTSDAG
jgi:hypothetical protein